MNIFYEEIAAFCKVLSDKNRLIILTKLAGGQKSVSQIIDETKLSQPLVSHHLKELKNSLLVKTERRGPFVFCELTEPALTDFIRLANQLLIELKEKNRKPLPKDEDFAMPFNEMMKNMLEIRNNFRRRNGK